MTEHPMTAQTLTDLATPSIEDQYRAKTPGSAARASRAAEVLPSGIAHDSRRLLPYPIYVERAMGSRKWDVDGNEYVDYAGGHGALLLGHAHPQVMAAVAKQLEKGTHYGACHDLEIRWAELIRQLMPAAEKVRFTSSGTEATLLALRLARAYTEKPKIIRLAGHFHGWQDHVAFGAQTTAKAWPSPGVLKEIAGEMLILPPGDIAALEQTLAAHDDIAALIFEPTGASWGQVPLPPGYVQTARELTAKHGVLLICDEVITGFRVGPGGAQGHYGIRPDLTTLAKIVAGGLPGGAVAGRRDVMDLLEFRPGREKVPHQGTFNANPLSAAAGIATLELVAGTDACARANAYAAELRVAMNDVLRAASLDWCVYGSFSGFFIFTNPQHLAVTPADIEAGRLTLAQIKHGQHASLIHDLRLAMLIHGVELFAWFGGPTSAVHTADDLALTVDAFRKSVQMVRVAEASTAPAR